MKLLPFDVRASMCVTAAAAALALTVSGCASDPTPAPILLTLPNANPVAATSGASSTATSSTAVASPGSSAAEQPLLAVRRIGIPEYVVARRVRYRADASTLAEWPNTFWAERIEIGVSREFVSTLRAQLPGWTICENNCGDRAPALALQVDMAPLDYLRGAQRLQARARVVLSSTTANPRVLQAQEWSYDIASTSDSAQGQAQAIAEAIRQAATATATLVRSTKR